MGRVVELAAESNKLEKQLESERQEAVGTRKALNKISASLKCQICISHDVTHVMAPCGHTICLTCLDQLQRNKY